MGTKDPFTRGWAANHRVCNKCLLWVFFVYSRAKIKTSHSLRLITKFLVITAFEDAEKFWFNIYGLKETLVCVVLLYFRHRFMSKLDVFVMALFVRFYYMSLSLLIKHFPHVLFISQLRLVPYLFTCFWVFWNYLFMEERLAKRYTINFRHRHVNELTFLVATHVIIANVSVSLPFDPYFK